MIVQSGEKSEPHVPKNYLRVPRPPGFSREGDYIARTLKKKTTGATLKRCGEATEACGWRSTVTHPQSHRPAL